MLFTSFFFNAFNIIIFTVSLYFLMKHIKLTKEQNVNRHFCLFSPPFNLPSSLLTNKAAPHSPRRQKLNLRMKSLSLDSPESTELHGRGRRYPPSTSAYQHGGSGGQLEHSTPPSNSSRLHCNFIHAVQKIGKWNKKIFFSTFESIDTTETFVRNSRSEVRFRGPSRWGRKELIIS